MSSSKGAIVNLASRGIQDVKIIGDSPSMFRQRFSKHTNVSQAPVKITGHGSNTYATYKITGCGDIINRMWLEHPTTPLTGTNFLTPDEFILEDAIFTLVIGGQIIDRVSYKFMNGIAAPYLAESSSEYNSHPGPDNNFSNEHRRIYPLQFFFTRKDGFLPLVALQYHEAEIQVEWGSKYTDPKIPFMYVNAVYLDTPEREMFAKHPFELLVTQVQRLTLESQSSEAHSLEIDLSYLNHPVKAIFFGFWEPLKDADDKSNHLFGGATLLLNGTPLFENMSDSYFGYIQPLHHSPYSSPNMTDGGPLDTRFYMYSFALDQAGSLQPSGHCNFSRLDNSTLKLTGLKCTSTNDSTDGIKPYEVYAYGYNVLRFSGGMAGILYGN